MLLWSNKSNFITKYSSKIKQITGTQSHDADLYQGWSYDSIHAFLVHVLSVFVQDGLTKQAVFFTYRIILLSPNQSSDWQWHFVCICRVSPESFLCYCKRIRSISIKNGNDSCLLELCGNATEAKKYNLTDSGKYHMRKIKQH